MNENTSIKPIVTIWPLLVSIALVWSCNTFAAKTDVATQAELDAAVAAQGTVDAGQNTTITAQGTLINALQAEIANLKALIEKYHPIPKKIGDFYGGGIVFYVDSTGQHGLIASLSDHNNSTGIQWYNGINKVTGATGDGVGAGASNTMIIVAAQSDDTPGGSFAAKVAADFSVQDDGVTPCTGSPEETCHGDWYLPSKHELNLLYLQKAVVGGFINGGYWTSTESDNIEFNTTTAWQQQWGTGYQGIYFKDTTMRVRAIRAF